MCFLIVYERFLGGLGIRAGDLTVKMRKRKNEEKEGLQLPFFSFLSLLTLFNVQRLMHGRCTFDERLMHVWCSAIVVSSVITDIYTCRCLFGFEFNRRSFFCNFQKVTIFGLAQLFCA